MNIYSMKDWERDGSLNPKIGQTVTDDIIDELDNCLPPHRYSGGVFQPGEAYSHDWDTGKALYQTFERRKIGWEYVGLKP